MIKRVAVAGSRNYENDKEAEETIDFCIREIREKYALIFVSGGCHGADVLGERYAATRFRSRKISGRMEKIRQSGRIDQKPKNCGSQRLYHLLLGWAEQRNRRIASICPKSRKDRKNEAYKSVGAEINRLAMPSFAFVRRNRF